VTDEPLEMNHVHFLVAPRIEKSRDFSAHVVYIYIYIKEGFHGKEEPIKIYKEYVDTNLLPSRSSKTGPKDAYSFVYLKNYTCENHIFAIVKRICITIVI